MVQKFNEFINERGFYFGQDEEMPGEDRFEEEMPTSKAGRPEMKIGDQDTQALFHEIDQAVMRLMKSSGLSMGEIMDHIADVAADYRSSSEM
jgi:hypothetical protein